MKYDIDTLHDNALRLYESKMKFGFWTSFASIVIGLIVAEILLPYGIESYRPTFMIAFISSLLFSALMSKAFKSLLYRKLNLKWVQNGFLKLYAIGITTVVAMLLSYAIEPITYIPVYYETVTQMSIVTATLLGVVGGFETPEDLYVDFEGMDHEDRIDYFDDMQALDPSDITFVAKGLKKLTSSEKEKESLDDIINKSYEVRMVRLKYKNESQIVKDFIKEMGES